MLAKSVIVGLLSLAVVSEASVINQGPFDHILGRRALATQTLEVRQNKGKNGNKNGGGSQTCLNSNAVQTGSQQDGSNGGQQEAGQAKSNTDNANFINFCSGQTLTNGLQQKQGSCNGIPMGKMPAQNKMVSGVLTNPPHNGNIKANQDFDIVVQTQNLKAGTFTNPANTYYSAPQDVDSSGQIIGHTHVVVQDMGGSLNPSNPPDPTQFAFFKGINDAGDGKGKLKATVTGGLPAGNYRVCTMTASSNHQPVLMPIAQRGAQDDCNKFTVGGNGGGNAGGNGGGNAGKNANSNKPGGGGSGAPGRGKGRQ